MTEKSMRLGAAIAAALCCLASQPLAAAGPAATLNPYNDELMRLPPDGQAAKLAELLGVWCIGNRPFFMGITRAGHARGYAYWSLECAGAGSYAIQIDPDGKGTATDCRELAESGSGRECFKKF